MLLRRYINFRSVVLQLSCEHTHTQTHGQTKPKTSNSLLRRLAGTHRNNNKKRVPERVKQIYSHTESILINLNCVLPNSTFNGDTLTSAHWTTPEFRLPSLTPTACVKYSHRYRWSSTAWPSACHPPRQYGALPDVLTNEERGNTYTDSNFTNAGVITPGRIQGQ